MQNDDNDDPLPEGGNLNLHDATINAIVKGDEDDFRRASLVPGSSLLLQRSNSSGGRWKSVRDRIVAANKEV